MSITAISISQSFWNFVQNTAVILPCSVQNFKVTGQLSNEISWELCSWDNIIMFQYKTDWAPCICIWACMQISQTIWNFVQSTAVILPCSVQNFKLIGQLSNEISWEFYSWDNIIMFQYNTGRVPCICICACMHNICWLIASCRRQHASGRHQKWL